MFTIHVFIAGKLVPLVYCLIVHKDLSTYREIFDNLILKAATLVRPDPSDADDISGDPHAKVLLLFLPSSSPVGDGSWDAYQLHPWRRIQVKSQNVAGNGFFAASSYTCC
ncbi:hypothetical protein T06_12653, partial [Trichinella sp. T6]